MLRMPRPQLRAWRVGSQTVPQPEMGHRQAPVLALCGGFLSGQSRPQLGQNRGKEVSADKRSQTRLSCKRGLCHACRGGPDFQAGQGGPSTGATMPCCMLVRHQHPPTGCLRTAGYLQTSCSTLGHLVPTALSHVSGVNSLPKMARRYLWCGPCYKICTCPLAVQQGHGQASAAVARHSTRRQGQPSRHHGKLVPTFSWLHFRPLLHAVHLQAEQSGQGQAAAAAARQMHRQGGPDLVLDGSSTPSDEAAAAAEAEVDPFGDFLEGLEGASGDLESQLAKLEQEEEVPRDPARCLAHA